MDSLGILPAAGLCSRWNGTYKELLPVGENKWIIDYSIDAMKLYGVKDFVVVSSPKKISAHVEHFKKDKYKDIHINYVIQYEPIGLFDALQKACYSFQNYDVFYFSMPDTIFTNGVFNVTLDNEEELCIGIFDTTTPEKFGIIDSLIPIHIVDKPKEFTDGIGKYIAWGTFMWGKYFNSLLCNAQYDSLQELVNQYCEAMPDRIKFSEIALYNDIASWKEYEEWIKLD